MKYLLVSDIHGCRPALEKVLKFYDEQHCDMLCILGDIFRKDWILKALLNC